MARMKDPQIHGEMYQRGPMYDAENLKAYVFARDVYRCTCCGKKAGTIRKDGTVVKLAAHHILFRSRGATDNPKYLASVCDACHTAEAHKPGGILYEWMEQEKQFTRGLRDAISSEDVCSRRSRELHLPMETLRRRTGSDYCCQKDMPMMRLQFLYREKIWII